MEDNLTVSQSLNTFSADALEHLGLEHTPVWPVDMERKSVCEMKNEVVLLTILKLGDRDPKVGESVQQEANILIYCLFANTKKLIDCFKGASYLQNARNYHVYCGAWHSTVLHLCLILRVLLRKNQAGSTGARVCI